MFNSIYGIESEVDILTYLQKKLYFLPYFNFNIVVCMYKLMCVHTNTCMHIQVLVLEHTCVCVHVYNCVCICVYAFCDISLILRSTAALFRQ